ncbi:MAG: ribose 5-phosphate isomerase B [Chloroflexota bacterium]
MRLVVGGDHAGFALKGPVVNVLRSWGHEVNDVGTHTPDRVDFPDIARQLCEAVLSGAAERGIMVCGTGVGASIACNKVPGIRAAVGHDVYTAHQCVEHDDVQVLCLGAQIIGERLAFDVLQVFLDARFSGEEHFARRIAKLAQLERRPGVE